MRHYLNDLGIVLDDLIRTRDVAALFGSSTDELKQLDDDIKLGQMLAEHAQQNHRSYARATRRYLARFPELFV